MTAAVVAPVVLFAFNRPEHTRKVFEAIRQAKPSRLLIVLDAPRTRVESDQKLCSQVLEIVSDVDWECDVDYQIAETNLGIRRRFVSGLEWVFSRVSEAIILEDDCLPSPAFFRFVSQMLATYRNADAIGIVSGFNPIGDSKETEYSHLFGPVPYLWGWGTWGRVWNTYDQSASKWLNPVSRRIVRSALNNAQAYRFWKLNFDLVSKNPKYSTWDYQVVFDQLLRNRLTVFPAKSLVSNIGFEYGANHTRDVSHPLANVQKYNPDLQYFDHPPIEKNLRFWNQLSSSLYRTTLLEFWVLSALFTSRSENFHRLVFSAVLRIKGWVSRFGGEGNRSESDN
jgi:hypothetical protein